MFVEKLEVEPEITGEPRCASSNDDRDHKDPALIDELGSERLRGQVSACDGNVRLGFSFHLPDRAGVELMLDTDFNVRE